MRDTLSGIRPQTAASYALSQLGGHIGFVPLFALLLPRRIEMISPLAPGVLLSWVLLAGGITASLAHIWAGGLSDWLFRARGSRRALILAGLVLTVASYGLLSVAHTRTTLIAGIVIFQLSFNVMFAPLGALLTDYFPNAAKGRMASLVNAALPLANLATSTVAAVFLVDAPAAFGVVAALVVLCVAPLLIGWPFDTNITHKVKSLTSSEPPAPNGVQRGDFARAWIARLLVQFGAAFMMNYFFLFLAQRFADTRAHVIANATEQVGQLAMVSIVAAILTTLLAGYWSDVYRRRVPMSLAATCGACALVMIGLSDSWIMIVIGYVGFQSGLTAFLTIDTALVAQLLARHPRRGKLLGYMNLTNTLPMIIVPIITLATIQISTTMPWKMCFIFAAISTLGAAILVLRIRSVA